MRYSAEELSHYGGSVEIHHLEEGDRLFVLRPEGDEGALPPGVVTDLELAEDDVRLEDLRKSRRGEIGSTAWSDIEERLERVREASWASESGVSVEYLEEVREVEAKIGDHIETVEEELRRTGRLEMEGLR